MKLLLSLFTQIQHRFANKEYSGKVLGVVPGYPQWFNVKYDEDDALYIYRLLEDYKQGDLKIVC